MKLSETVARGLLSLRSGLHRIPSVKLVNGLKGRHVDLASLRALEMFGGVGFHTRSFEPHVRSLEVWEIDSGCEAALRRNVPTAVVKITDSYKELAATREKFDLVLADMWVELFDGHCEHFELFPGLFRILEDKALLVLNVVLDWNTAKLKREYRFYEEHLSRRRGFYQCDDSARAPLSAVVKRYTDLARENGFETRWWFLQDRYFLYPLRKKSKKWRLCYLVLALEKAVGGGLA